MHELAIIQGVLEIVDAEAFKCSAKKAKRIKLRIGEFTGVVPESLEFSFESISLGTISENAELEIELVPLRKWCAVCGVASANGPFSFVCPTCNSALEILSGREMQVEYIDFD